MTDWIEHDGGPQPVADDVWVEVLYPGAAEMRVRRAGDRMSLVWKNHKFKWFILNQHLIDAKQAEIDALKEDLAIWDSVFPDLLPDRLKSDKQLADEDVAAKIDAARIEGIRLGLEAADKAIEALYANDVTDRQMALEDASMAVCALNSETIAREAVLDQLTREAQAQGMGYDPNDAKENTR
jgi:hypothetical protein